MKRISFLMFVLFLISGITKAQTYTLLDRRWYKPAIFTDSITKANLSDGWYPIYKSEIDSLIVIVSRLKNLKADGLERKFYYSEDFKTEHSVFQIENIKRTYGDGYEINMITNTSFGSITLKLSDPDLKLTANQINIRAFLSYLILTQKSINNPGKKKKNNIKNNPNVN